MKKGTIAGLACALCASGSKADTVNVEVYGTLLPFLDVPKTTGATTLPVTNGPNQVPNSATGYTGLNQEARGRLTSGTSNLGFRGNVTIGGDWKAIFQVEAAVPLDGDQGPQGLLATRNSHVGITGPYGTMFFGIWDTPYKWTTITMSPVRGLNPFDYDNTLENPGFNVPGTTTQGGRVAGKADAAFSRRQGNSIQYWSPNVFGFTARAAYSLNEGKTQVAGGSWISPDVISASLSYEQPNLFLVRYAYEQHDDYFGMSQIGGSAGASATNHSSKDMAHKLLAGLILPTTKIYGVIERLIYDTDDTAPAAVKHYRRDAWFLEGIQRFGDAGIWVSFGQSFEGECSIVSGAACSTHALGGMMYSVGAMYDFGKRTTLYASYFGVVNDDAASYGIFPAVGTTAAGADTRSFGIGILHTF
jgi:predicted porin